MGGGIKETRDYTPVWRESSDSEGSLIKVACGIEKLGLIHNENKYIDKENEYIDPGDLWLLGLLLEYTGKCDSSAVIKIHQYLNKWGLSQEEFTQKRSADAGFRQGETLPCWYKKELLEARGFL